MEGFGTSARAKERGETYRKPLKRPANFPEKREGDACHICRATTDPRVVEGKVENEDDARNVQAIPYRFLPTTIRLPANGDHDAHTRRLAGTNPVPTLTKTRFYVCVLDCGAWWELKIKENGGVGWGEVGIRRSSPWIHGMHKEKQPGEIKHPAMCGPRMTATSALPFKISIGNGGIALFWNVGSFLAAAVSVEINPDMAFSKSLLNAKTFVTLLTNSLAPTGYMRFLYSHFLASLSAKNKSARGCTHQQGPPTQLMQTGSSAPVYRPPLQQPQSSHGISSTRFATGIRGARIKIASTALNSGMMVLKESTADTMNSDGLGNYTFDEKSDFTDQHDDLMDVTFDPITAPGNDDRYVRSDASDTKSDLVGEYVDATIVSLHVVIVDFVGQLAPRPRHTVGEWA
ncbi:hypothetical protein DFH94DRAFT_821369 [Russula ochroleuca]|uniref:Uncharacterized protein n=1 Tax=Russula ochroleuca TaxID=152965 RepID=A0A9P5JW16_9AGAM|nr:hypothetical protein DFH94DRAFT_821369 [Russula ochroleuca]